MRAGTSLPQTVCGGPTRASELCPAKKAGCKRPKIACRQQFGGEKKANCSLRRQLCANLAPKAHRSAALLIFLEFLLFLLPAGCCLLPADCCLLSVGSSAATSGEQLCVRKHRHGSKGPLADAAGC